MGVDYVVIGFDMEVQPLITHNATDLYLHDCYLQRCREKSKAIHIRAIGIDVVSGHKQAVCIDVMSSHMKYCRITYGITR